MIFIVNIRFFRGQTFIRQPNAFTYNTTTPKTPITAQIGLRKPGHQIVNIGRKTLKNT